MIVRLNDGMFDVRLSTLKNLRYCVTTFSILWHNFIIFSIFLGFVKKLWRVIFTAAQQWLSADLLIHQQAAAAAGNLVLSKGIAPNASIEAI